MIKSKMKYKEYFFTALLLVIIFSDKILADCKEVEIDPCVPQEISIDFTAFPESGPVPLEITFECEAEAYVHYADWVCVETGSGGKPGDPTSEPLFQWEIAQSVNYPEDVVTLNSPGTYEFSAEADYEDVVKEKIITYECPDRNHNTEFVTDSETEVTYGDWISPKTGDAIKCRIVIVTMKVKEMRDGVRYGGEDFYDMRLRTTITKTYYDAVYPGCIWSQNTTSTVLTGELLPLAICKQI